MLNSSISIKNPVFQQCIDISSSGTKIINDQNIKIQLNVIEKIWVYHYHVVQFELVELFHFVTYTLVFSRLKYMFQVSVLKLKRGHIIWKEKCFGLSTRKSNCLQSLNSCYVPKSFFIVIRQILVIFRSAFQ